MLDLCFCCHISSASDPAASFLYPCDHTVPTWVIQDALPILTFLTVSHLQSPFAMQGNIHRFLGLGCERLWWGLLFCLLRTYFSNPFLKKIIFFILFDFPSVFFLLSSISFTVFFMVSSLLLCFSNFMLFYEIFFSLFFTDTY